MSNLVGAVHVIAATGRSGKALCQSLSADDVPFIPIARNPARATGAQARIADLTDAQRLRDALHDASRIACCSHARHAAAVIAAAPRDARFVFLGSTRKFTRWPDAHANGVLAGEVAFLASGRSGVMLHPAMIYGAQGEDNVRRLAALLRRVPLVPLPGGGRALVQPIHQDDVTRAIRAALDLPWRGPHSLVIAGPTPLPYADFVLAVASAAGLRAPRIVSVSAGPLIALARVLRYLPFLPRIHPAEIRRLTEDKSFDVRPMIDALGFEPVSLPEGLARTFATTS